MNDQANVAVVGAFVLALGALLVAGVLWLAAGLGGHQTMVAYQAVIQESVAGLSVDAPVKYLGVDVGKVHRIEIDPQNPLQVRLQFLVAQGTPIKRDSVAVLKTQGLTGIAYVELSGGSLASPPLVAGADGTVPTIPFKPSLSARLENVLTSVLTNLDRVSDNLNAVFDADNRAAFKSALADAAITAKLTARAGERLDPALARIASSAQAVERMAGVAESASARAGETAEAATRGVQQLGSETLPELARLMAELNQLSASLRLLSEQTVASPSSLLLGNPPLAPGPGERTQ